MAIRILDARALREALPMTAAIHAMRTAFLALHRGEALMPTRAHLDVGDGVALFMPAVLRGSGAPGLGQKVVTVYPGNRDRGLPTIHALVTLFDAETGAPRALLEGRTLTAIRTGAVSGLATDLLARQDAGELTIFGAGAQAADQIAAVLEVRPIHTINILSRGEGAERLAERLQRADRDRRYRAVGDGEAAVRAADVVVTATPSLAPLFAGEVPRVGTHVNAIGSYRPDMREVDGTLLSRADIYVDERAAARAEAGDLLLAEAEGSWSPSRVLGELGELVAAEAAGESAERHGEITFFKSCGLAVEDVAAGMAALEAAERLGLGTVLDLDAE